MRLTCSFLIILLAGNLSAQVTFDDYFTEKCLRIDYYLSGDASQTVVSLAQLKKEPYWAGNYENLIDPFNYGKYKILVYDKGSDKLIYSKGFCTLFQEWQTTAEAHELKRSYYQVNTIPFPKKPVRFEIHMREKGIKFSKIFEYSVDPGNYFILNENPIECNVTKIHGDSKPDESVDVAFIAEGYTFDEMDKFRTDVKRMAKYLFSTPPFDKYKDKFNIWAVEAISEESGTDIPGEMIYKKTALNSGFYTFDIARYLTTNDLKSIYDYAANVPYDQVYVLINSERYGGGGIYNHYSATTSDHELTPKVLVHEFGHGFAGLADEYYSSAVAYEDFYPSDIEPWEPNITTLVDFDSKWKDMIDKKTPVPTPPDVEYAKTIGVFEGGGYMAKGVYRPYIDCRMNTNEASGFCPVCQRAISRMIEYYIGRSKE